MAKKVLTWLAILFVVFWLLSAPTDAANTVDEIFSWLGDAARSLRMFLTSLGD